MSQVMREGMSGLSWEEIKFRANRLGVTPEHYVRHWEMAGTAMDTVAEYSIGMDGVVHNDPHAITKEFLRSQGKGR